MDCGALFDGERVEAVDCGVVVDVWIRPCHDEIERRRSNDVGAMVEQDHIEALMDLPVGIPVSMPCLGGGILLSLEGLLDLRAVEISDDAVTRIAVPPVGMVGMSKVASCWDDARSITWLGPHAPRYVIASSRLAQRTIREVDPQVGVARQHGGRFEILRQAGSRRVLPSWQRWVIMERASQRWLEKASLFIRCAAAARAHIPSPYEHREDDL